VLLENASGSQSEKKVAGQKISKERVSALMCANANGSHMLKHVIVGKSGRCLAVNGIMHKLHAHY
jgi:hypothetical protein